jgi:hypothetical protein
MSEQSKAIELADDLEQGRLDRVDRNIVAKELRRQHAEIEALHQGASSAFEAHYKLEQELSAMKAQKPFGYCRAWTLTCLQESQFREAQEFTATKIFSKPTRDFIYPIYTAPQAPAAPVSERLHLGQPTRSQFLADVLTAAGLIRHGKQSKALADRLGDYWQLETNAAVEDSRAAQEGK